MSFCKGINFDPKNQHMIDQFLFIDYDPSDVNMSPDGISFEIHIGKQGPKLVENPNYFRFVKVRKLGSGSYGTVLKYVDNIKNVVLAVKFATANDEEEISNILNQSNCNSLRVKYAEKQVYMNGDLMYMYFMELADGDLDHFLKSNVKQLTKKVIIDIAESIRKQVTCLFNLDNKYVYTDMKLENILYRCDEKNMVHFMLGDLGSAVEQTGDYIATYPPVGFYDGYLNLKTKKEKEGALGWGMGILLLFLATFYMNRTSNKVSVAVDEIEILRFGSIQNVKNKDMVKFKLNLDYLQSELKLNVRISNYLSSDPKVRASLLYTPIKPGSPSIKPSVSPSVKPSVKPNAKLTIVQLREQAKKAGCKRYSKMKKEELIRFIPTCKIQSVSPSVKPQVQSVNMNMTVVQLREIAKEKGCKGCKGYTKLLKAQLIQFIKTC